MTAFLNHWLIVDFWAQVWPNLAASPICAASVLVSHVLRERAARARHAELLGNQHCSCAGGAR
ncbi:hypothetical protein [Streptacidiphilus albus]|uniref:hypothetical protein n=1 Tax=Streptacidiphilus albus TaxID=105425 RepID=UPI00054B07F5|nr:hypothetical protein [Streptacidiphilus albus]